MNNEELTESLFESRFGFKSGNVVAKSDSNRGGSTRRKLSGPHQVLLMFNTYNYNLPGTLMLISLS